ncbi:hypothetical protein PENTCL1PPCAC_3174, partial [Pristionchus entomophagus]
VLGVMGLLQPHDPTIQFAIRISKLILTCLSFVLAVMCMIVVRKTKSLTNDYANLLLFLIVYSTLFEIFSQLIYDPQFIMPVFCIYRDAPFINIPFNAAWGFIIWMTLVALNAPLYAISFLHRHQIIVPENSLLKLNRLLHSALLIVIAVPCLSYGYAYYVS